MPTFVLRDERLVLVAALPASVMRDVLRPVVGSQSAVYGPIELDDVDVVGDADRKVEMFDVRLVANPPSPLTRG